MTVEVGILCSDGVVIASDSAATLGDGFSATTVGQQEVEKIQKLTESIIFCGSGPAGLSQLIAHKIRNMTINSFNSPEEAMNAAGLRIRELVGPYLETASKANMTHAAVCLCMLAFPVRHEPCLFSFNPVGLPEMAKKTLPFVAIGSGQRIADPFLTFLKRLLWDQSRQPSVAEGQFAAMWALKHVIETNPGGVGGTIQLATLTMAGNKPKIAFLDKAESEEHYQNIDRIEKNLVEQITASKGEAKEVPSV